MDLVGKNFCMIGCNMPGNKKNTVLFSKMIVETDSINKFCEEWNGPLKCRDLWEQLYSGHGRDVAASMFGEKKVRALGKMSVPFASLSEALNSQLRIDYATNFVLIYDWITNDICWYNSHLDSANDRLNRMGK